MSTGIVVFDYQAWSLRYPELAASVSAPLAAQYFAEAGMYCDNTPRSSVCYDSITPANTPQRPIFLGMITAHIAALNAPLGGQPSSPLVGRISSAGEGSVNVSTELEGQLHGRAYWAQTKYGLAFWQASAQYRTMRYTAPYPQVTDPWAPRQGPWGGPYGGGPWGGRGF